MSALVERLVDPFVTLRVMDVVRTQPVTWRQFVELPDDDLRELIDGVLVEGEMPTKKHEWIVGTLVALLWNWARAHDGGMVFPSGYKIRVADHRGVRPDVVFIRKGRGTSRARREWRQGPRISSLR